MLHHDVIRTGHTAHKALFGDILFNKHKELRKHCFLLQYEWNFS